MPEYSDTILGSAPRDPDQQFWDPEMQTMDRERLRELQAERLRTMVGRIIDRPVPLFKRKLDEAGIGNAADIEDVDDLDAIPLTVKQELRDSEAEHPPFGDYRFDVTNVVRLGTSTGTTGTPTVSLFTRHDIWLEYESAARNYWRNGWRPGMTVTHAHPAYLYGGGAMLSGCLEYFGMCNIWVAPPDTDEIAEQGIKMWERLKPDVSFVAFSLGRFQEVAAKMGLDLQTDVGLPGYDLRGMGDKGMPLMTAGLECYANSSGPCGVDPGGHLHEDWAIIQAINPRTGREVPDGEWGDLVVTTLDRDNGMLRYDLEEAVAIVHEPCSCGETTYRAFWGGRFKDFIACQDKHFQVNEVERALRRVEEVKTPSLEYVVVRPADHDAPLLVRVEIAEGDRETVAARCVVAIRDVVGVEATVEMLERDSLERSGYKATRLVDK